MTNMYYVKYTWTLWGDTNLTISTKSRKSLKWQQGFNLYGGLMRNIIDINIIFLTSQVCQYGSKNAVINGCRDQITIIIIHLTTTVIKFGIMETSQNKITTATDQKYQ